MNGRQPLTPNIQPRLRGIKVEPNAIILATPDQNLASSSASDDILSEDITEMEAMAAGTSRLMLEEVAAVEGGASTDEVLDLTTFEYFPKLPAEIRFKIYYYILKEPRTHKIRLGGRIHWWDSHRRYVATKQKLPTVFHLCIESRLEAFHSLGFNDKNPPPKKAWSLFDPEVDIFYFPFPIALMRTREWETTKYAQYVDGMLARFALPKTKNPSVEVSLIQALHHISLDLATIILFLRLPSEVYPHFVTRGFEDWIGNLPCRLALLKTITLHWSAHDMKQVKGDEPTFPENWLDAIDGIDAVELQQRLQKIAEFFQEVIDIKDDLPAGHMIGSSNIACCRNVYLRKHSNVKVRLVQVQRIGVPENPAKRFLKKVGRAVKARL